MFQPTAGYISCGSRLYPVYKPGENILLAVGYPKKIKYTPVTHKYLHD